MHTGGARLKAAKMEELYLSALLWLRNQIEFKELPDFDKSMVLSKLYKKKRDRILRMTSPSGVV